MEAIIAKINAQKRNLVTFIYGESRIKILAKLVVDDSAIFAAMFGDISCDFEVDLSKLANVNPQSYILYLSALHGYTELTPMIEYELYDWTQSEMIKRSIEKRISRVCDQITKEDTPDAASEVIEFVQFIILNEDRGCNFIDLFAAELIKISRMALSWSKFEKYGPRVCVFMMELYYMLCHHVSCSEIKDNIIQWLNDDCEIIFEDNCKNAECAVIYDYYLILFGLDRNKMSEWKKRKLAKLPFVPPNFAQLRLMTLINNHE